MSNNVTLEEQVQCVKDRVRGARKRYGSVHLMAASNNPLVTAGITAIGGVPIHVEDGVFIADTTGASEDIPVVGSLLLIEAQCMFADSQGRCSEDSHHGLDCDDEEWL